ncbi:MAG: flagellar biosynthesis anti-sigma factor FlgM [Pseudomonadota bacterium]|nr:flagellar biosynthesis anti-sigma factor FlgM [Pseudomonadota bacterium]
MKVDNSKIRDSLGSQDSAKSGKVGPSGININKKDGKGAAATDNVGGDYARVDISKRAQDTLKVKELATPNMNAVDEAKVAHFQKLIDDGKYSIDSKELADKILSEHLFSD